MARKALVTAALAALTVPATVTAAEPKWTAHGKITKLNAHTITVGGTSCRITARSPNLATLRRSYVGAVAKIACDGGVLRAIDASKRLPPTTSTTTTSVALSRTTTPTTTSENLLGRFPITALSDNSITAGAGSISVTCRIGRRSPNIGGLSVGQQLSRLICRNGVLTSVTPA